MAKAKMKPTTVPWTPEMDAKLLALRAATKTWKVIVATMGLCKSECQSRLDMLEQPMVASDAPQRKATEPVAIVRDGLDWLISKGRLTPKRVGAANAYRDLFREAELQQAAPLGSSLDPDKIMAPHTGSGGGGPTDGLLSAYDAKRALFEVRHIVLAGQTDMLTVLDGVCGTGRSLRELADNDGHRAATLEAVLCVALDLIVAHQARSLKKAA